MTARVATVAFSGVECVDIDVQVQAASGLPAFTIVGLPDKAVEVLEAIKANTKAIRFDLGQRVHLQLRKIPELTFYIDDSLDYIEKIDNLLKK